MKGLPVLKARELIQALRRAGFYIHHQTGSHVRMLHITKPDLKITIPCHVNDIPKPTLKNILRQADITVEELLNFL